jgi:hypothetical protein
MTIDDELERYHQEIRAIDTQIALFENSVMAIGTGSVNTTPEHIRRLQDNKRQWECARDKLLLQKKRPSVFFD